MFEYLYDYINIYIKCSRDSDGCFLRIYTNIGGRKDVRNCQKKVRRRIRIRILSFYIKI